MYCGTMTVVTLGAGFGQSGTLAGHDKIVSVVVEKAVEVVNAPIEELSGRVVKIGRLHISLAQDYLESNIVVVNFSITRRFLDSVSSNAKRLWFVSCVRASPYSQQLEHLAQLTEKRRQRKYVLLSRYMAERLW